jgi:hypothetical protein
MNKNVRENRYSEYLRMLPPLEMAIVRWDMSRLPLVRVMLHVNNRTWKNYDRIVWNCDFYDKNKRSMGSALIVTENVPKNSEGRPSQTIYQKWLFDASECVLVRADVLPWER